MARFVSANRSMIVTVQTDRDEYVGPNGQLVPRKRLLEAVFSHDALQEQDITLAKLARSQGGLANIDVKPDGSLPESPFRGQTQDESGKFLPVETRLSVFDSEQMALREGWLPEEEALVVDKLRETAGASYIEVKPQPASLPWSGYDKVEDPARALEIVGMIEADLTKVLQYERENKDRADFINAFEAEIAELEEQDVVVSA